MMSLDLFGSVVDRQTRCPVSGLLVSLLLVQAASVISVQAQGTQVPFDRDSTVYSIDRELRQELGLFPAISGFREAVLYRLSDGQYELVLRYQQDGVRRRERRTLESADVQSLRGRVTGGVSGSRESRAFTQDGRYDLIASTTIHGLVQGALITGALDADGGTVVTLPLLGAGAGFFFPLFATRDARVTDAEADMTFYGGLQGYAHTVQLSYLLGDDALNGRATAGLAALIGAGEGVAAYEVARRNNWRAGHAKMVSFTGLTGNLVGLGVSGLIFGRVESRTGAVNRSAAGTSLIGSLAGAYVGHRMGRTNRYSKGDARIYLLSAVQTVNLAGSFLSLGNDRSVRLSSAILTGAALGGGLLGRRLVRDRGFTAVDGNLIGLGSVAGSLLGLAFTVEAESGSARAIVQALGSTAGFGMTYALMDEEAGQRGNENASAIQWEVNLSPTMAERPGRTDGRSIVEEVQPRLSLSATF